VVTLPTGDITRHQMVLLRQGERLRESNMVGPDRSGFQPLLALRIVILLHVLWPQVLEADVS
jgi:hypothetical protein